MPVVLGSGRGQGQKHALPEVSVKGGQGEAKGYTESCAEKEKGGEGMTREDVVQAALTVERWCKDHFLSQSPCNCPFSLDGEVGDCKLFEQALPYRRHLESFLRTRGLKHDD